MRRIQNAALKGQCQEDNFYGKELEKGLQAAEGELASLLRKFEEPSFYPALHTPERAKLINHISMQWSRTRVAADRTDEAAAEVARMTIQERFIAFLKEKQPAMPQAALDSIKFGLPDPVKTSLGHGIVNAIFLSDLALKIVTATPSTEFAISDNPVVMTNPFFLGAREGCVTGLNARGLVVLFPLSPSRLAVLYDPITYKIGSPSKNVFTVELADMVYLNNLQFLNAGEAVYVHNEKLTPSLVTEFRKVIGLRRKRLHTGHTVSSVKTVDGGSEEIVRFSNEDIHYAPPVSFLKRRQIGMVDFGYRDPLLSQLHSQFMEQAAKGVYQLSEFAEFVEIDARKHGILPVPPS